MMAAPDQESKIDLANCPIELGLQTVTDVALEYGHFDTRLTADDLPQQAVESADLARRLRAGLVAGGLEVQTQVLIDDKKDEFHGLEWLSEPARSLLEEIDSTCQIDLVTFESCLKEFRDALLSCLPEPIAGSMSRDMDKFILQTDMLACSHDIGIWNSLRLGALERSDILGWTPDGASQKLATARWGISVLGKNHRQHERSAERRILRHVASAAGPTCSQRILRLYVGAGSREITQIVMKILNSEGVTNDGRPSAAFGNGPRLPEERMENEARGVLPRRGKK